MALGRISAVVVSLLFVAAGVGAGALGWINYQNTQSDLENAVEADGQVVETDIVRQEREEDPDDDGVYEDTEISYEPVVVYTYTYEGEQYRSESLYPGGTGLEFDDRSEAEQFLSDYETGQSLTVKVNSAEPDRSFLIEKDDSLFLLGVTGVFGGIFTLVGLVTLVRTVFGDE
jgi:hypothetical protein